MTMTHAQAKAASRIELMLPGAATEIGPEYTVSAFMTALEPALNTDQMRELSRLLDRKADELERGWRSVGV